jgi:hypothetical protein
MGLGIDGTEPSAPRRAPGRAWEPSAAHPERASGASLGLVYLGPCYPDLHLARM